MSGPGVVLTGEDVRYAATYGNPYLRGSAPVGKLIVFVILLLLKQLGKSQSLKAKGSLILRI